MSRKHSRPQLSVHCGVYRGVFLPWWDGKGRDHPAPLIVVRGELALERDFPSACSWHPCPPSVLLPLEEEKKEEEVEKEVYKEVEGEEQVLPQVEEGLARQSPSNWGNNLDRWSGLVASKASLVDQNHRPQPLPSRHNQLHWLSRGAHHHSIGNDMAKLNVYVWNLFLVKITMTLWRLTLQSLSFGNDHQCYIFLSLNRVWMHVSISVILWWHSVPSYFIPFIKFLLPHVWPHIKYCWD